ncbi:MAG: esterase [Herminiimonas sp.]|nr:esterase [Herminiimonas sp.]
MILYLHGFKSSPQSFKARVIGDAMAAQGRAAQYRCPQLPASPAAAVALALSLVRAVPVHQLTVIGSSLGGFYATWIAEQLGCRAVLLNPAVQPPRDLEQYVGVGNAYHSDQPFEFKHAYIDELRALTVPAITRPERYLLIAATGDEVLDWRQMQAHYPGARQVIIQGGDHGISDFRDYLTTVLAFCDQPFNFKKLQ